MQEIPKVYNPKETEEKWYKEWEGKGYFHADSGTKKKPYSIVIPPPNITGILHMGHALNNTIQDILVRFKRMSGFETLWMPGTDHAGIATQNVVEKRLSKEGKHREELGREEFLKRVWKWREEYGSTIIHQLKRLGCSCDWERTRFTMDEGLSEAVQEVFIRLYEKGLIYRGDYIINWCPRCQTALSDEESEHRDVQGMFYHIKYPIKGTNEHVVVATTRPETMLGDVAVAVNPKDKRYKHLKGKVLELPVLKRELKIIYDEIVDKEFGTGALKVTPAHDPIDFQLGQKHGLKPINVMNPDATMNENAGETYSGMDRLECREALIEDLKERGLFIKSEPHRHAVGHCYRCHTMVEPRLSLQWFVKMKPLAKPAIEVVKKGKIKFHPTRWTKVYLNWMENIRDWCISRQIWWGHRIPVYYCKACVDPVKAKDKDAGVIASKEKPKKCPKCGGTDLVQDTDVLDTWFSSWLWPFSTFGWPQKNRDLKLFYPTGCLVTAQEIIFFWVARMIMSGLEFMKEIPFKDVYIHGTVRDDTGTKMSKSLGNVIDPLEIIDEFGCDALRFSIISITSTGQDVFLSKKRFETGRNFANKVWNVSRFLLTNLKQENVPGDLCVFAKDPSLTLADRWILSRLYETIDSVTKSIEKYRFNEAANTIYDFIWHQFCDWYVEFSKLTIDQKKTQFILYKVLEKSLRTLHPLMPFITEEIWSLLPHEEGSIMVNKWPHVNKDLIDVKIDKAMDSIIEQITAIRTIRATWRIEPIKRIEVVIKTPNKATTKSLNENIDYIKRLARVDKIDIGEKAKKPPKSATAVVGNMETYIPLAGIIDLEKEGARLKKQIDQVIGWLDNTKKKLSNKKFVEGAPKEVVEQQKTRQKELQEELKKLKSNLSDLK